MLKTSSLLSPPARRRGGMPSARALPGGRKPPFLAVKCPACPSKTPWSEVLLWKTLRSLKRHRRLRPGQAAASTLTPRSASSAAQACSAETQPACVEPPLRILTTSDRSFRCVIKAAVHGLRSHGDSVRRRVRPEVREQLDTCARHPSPRTQPWGAALIRNFHSELDS